ncbi:MAG TPA: OB-fold nucleic acid binding domain-containing protein, partial [Stellaceae bacterium]|nr:OB-fold nucleic acid binding domain-containing protein [Stellaceae bacterium]
FALLVYVSAWIKCFHPEVFACALLNSQPMGFYAPAQIVRDAREHGVEMRPVDINHSYWDCTLEPSIVAPAKAGAQSDRSDPGSLASRFRGNDGSRRWALRLGLRQIKGFAEADAERFVAAREDGYPDPQALWRRSGLGRGALERLAEADAFRSVGLDRRRALWALKALGDPPLPLFAQEPSPPIEGRGQGEGGFSGPASLASPTSPRPSPPPGVERENAAMALLPEMPLGEHVVEDYASLSLTLKRHPLAFLRTELARGGLVTAAGLAHLPVDRRLSIAGIVLIRQRPGSANGVVFITIEDETGIANLIVWPAILERFRRAALGATLLRCTGKLQREESVIHVVADHLADMTPRLNTLRNHTGEAAPKPPFTSPAKPPGYDPRDIVITSRDFR